MDELRKVDADAAQDEELLRPGQVAALLGVRPRTVARWAHRGLADFTKSDGGQLRFTRAEVERLRADLPEEHPSRRVHGRTHVDNPEDYNLRAEELAKALGWAVSKVYSMNKQGLLPSLLRGRTFWFNEAEVRELEATDPRLWPQQAGARRQTPVPPDKHHTVQTDSLALELGCSPEALRRMVRQGTMPHRVVGKRLWFNREEARIAWVGRKRAPHKPRVKPQAPDSKHTASGEQLAAELGLSMEQMRKWARSGLVDAVQVQARWWYDPATVPPQVAPVPPDKIHTARGSGLVAELGMTPKTLRKWRDKGLVDAVQHEGRWWYDPATVRALAASKRDAQQLRAAASNGDPAAAVGPPPDDRHTMTLTAAKQHVRGVAAGTLAGWVRKGVVPSVRDDAGLYWVDPAEVQVALGEFWVNQEPAPYRKDRL